MASVVRADVWALERACDAGTELADRLRRDAGELGDALDALRTAPSEIALDVAPADLHLDLLATQWAEVAGDLGLVAAAFRTVDDDLLGWLRAQLALVSVWAERRHTDRPWEVDGARVDAAVDTVRAALDVGGWGVRGDDLARIHDTLAGMSGAETDAVLARLTDDELATWFDQQHDGWLRGGWSASQRRELLVVLGEKVSLDTWRRLSRFTDEIDPPPREALGDTASADPARREFFEALTYAPTSGVLIAGGRGDHGPFAVDDARQGRIGDCYLVAAMQALAMHDPWSLADLVRPNPNGTFTVTFANGDQVVVSSDLPIRSDGHLAFARNGPGADGGTELWPMLVEKAVAQRAGGWGEIVGGSQSAAIELLTGRPSGWIDADEVRVADLADRVAAGEILGLSTIDAPSQDKDAVLAWVASDAPEPFRRGDGPWDRLHQNHAFIVTAVDADAGTVRVVNPWDPTAGSVVLTEDELRVSVNGVRVSGVAP